MIRLRRPAVPRELIARALTGTRKLWDEWRKTGRVPMADPTIYAHPSVKRALREAQHNKCAYCETRNPTSHDVVEHFRPKNGWRQKRGDLLQRPEYFWLSYDWENLVFACDRCNDAGHKQNLFPLANPLRRATPARPHTLGEQPLLLNPYTSDPERHIEWNRDVPRARNRSRRGRTTIEVFGLTRDGLLMDERRDYLAKVERVVALVESYSPQNAVRNEVRQDLLDRLRDEAPWAAMMRANLSSRISAL